MVSWRRPAFAPERENSPKILTATKLRKDCGGVKMRGGERGRRADGRTGWTHHITCIDGRGLHMRDAIARAATAVDVELHLPCSFHPSFIVCLSEERMMNGAIRRNKFPSEPPSRFTPSLQIASFTHSPLTSLRGLHQVHPTKADQSLS